MLNQSMLYNPQWSLLSLSEKEKAIKALLAQIPIRFELKEMRTFSENGLTTETALLEYGGEEFVFVPGAKDITLGWNSGLAGLETQLGLPDEFDYVLDPLKHSQDMLKEMEAEGNNEGIDYFKREVERYLHEPFTPNDQQREFYSTAGLVKYINESCSPVRVVSIPPMIVETHNREAGLRFVGQYNPLTKEHTLGEHFTAVEKQLVETFHSSKEPVAHMVEYHQTCRFEKANNEWYNVFLFKMSSRATLRKQLETEGFSLPTEDMWEYLCGGGRRTLFRFGNQFDEEMRYPYLNKVNILAEPNLFGLQIAYDQYRHEVVDSPCHTKGGDSGGSLCGGESFTYIMLPLSTYWRERERMTEYNPEYVDNYGLQGGYYFYRRVLVL